MMSKREPINILFCNLCSSAAVGWPAAVAVRLFVSFHKERENRIREKRLSGKVKEFISFVIVRQI